MFEWKKNGILFEVPKYHSWMNTHAQVPFTLETGDILRIYFSTREAIDENKMFRSYSGYVDFDKYNINRILSISGEPILPLGGKGEFDEFGSMAGSIIRHHDKYLLYYCGWTRCTSVPYNWSIGLATSKDGKHFRRMSKGPLLGPSFKEHIYKLVQLSIKYPIQTGICFISPENVGLNMEAT